MTAVALVASGASVANDPGPADYREIRLDLGPDTLEAIDTYAGDTPLIVTNRPSWAGGNAIESPNRIATLESALASPAVWAVDIEYDVLTGAVDPPIAAAAEDLLDLADATDTRVICSVHDHEGSPSTDALVDLARSTATLGDIGKLAVTPSDPAAFADLAGAVAEIHTNGLSVATMAMGRYATPSRVLSIAFDQPLVYGHAPGGTHTAPGQVSVTHLRAVVNALKTTDDAPSGDERNR